MGRRRGIVGGVLAALAVAGLGGCGASARLQRQELHSLTLTCQSLYERSYDRPAPRIPDLILRAFLAEPPHDFAGRTTRDQMRDICDNLPSPSPVPVPPRSRSGS